MRHPRTFLLSMLGLCCGLVPAAQAATWVWPDLNLILPGPCAGTLQACVNNAANGDSILIGNDSIASPDRYTGINGNLLINKSLTLAALPGIDAVFEGGNINVYTPAGVVGDVTLRGLILRGGLIRATEFGSSSVTVTFDQLQLLEPPAGQCAIYFDTDSSTIATPHLIASNNVIVMTEFGGSGVCVNSYAANFQADLFGNHIDARRAMQTSALAFGAGSNAGAMSLRLHRNRVLLDGGIGGAGIVIVHNNPDAQDTIEVVSNIIAGAGGAANSENAAITIKEHNALLTVVNNSISDGGVGIHVGAPGAGAVGGRIANNLITRQSVRGLRLDVALPNDHNLLHAVTANDLGPGGVLGAGTLTGDPLIESPDYPRPSGSSPAQGAGDNTALPAFAAFDADGEKRVQFGIVDIGALEISPDRGTVHTATALNTMFNATNLAHADFSTTLLAADRLIVTPLRAAAGASAGMFNLGVYQDNSLPGQWAIFQQDQTDIALGRRYSVLVPVVAHANLVHTVSAGNIPGSATAETEINDPALNGQAAAIAVVTANWNPPSAPGGIYHDHPITLVYRGTRWRIRNDDGASMNGAIGAAFNVAVAPLFSPNAFMAEIGAYGGFEIPLAHPLLDDNPCAAPIASRRVELGDGALTLNPAPYALEYREPLNANDIGRWFIVAEDVIGFSAHNAFNVIVEGAQANRCLARSDALFADGFD